MSPPSDYKVLGWGPAVGHGVSQAQYVQVSGVAKTNSDREPNIVSAEFIAARLGQAILLPIPPAFIVTQDAQPWFASLNFNMAGEDLPPVNPSEIVTGFPEASAGIVVFDAWMMNQDRHRRNLAYDSSTGRLQVFDHSRALMPGSDQREFAHRHRNDLAIGTKHCLAQHIVDELSFAPWISRISAIPEYYIEGILREAVQVGLDPENVSFFLQLLLRRRKRLPQLLKDNRSCFPALQLGLGSPLAWN